MSKQDKIILLQKFFHEGCSKDELKQLYNVLNSSKGEAEFADLINDEKINSNEVPDKLIDSEKILENIRFQIQSNPNKKRFISYKVLWYAAVFVCILTLAGLVAILIPNWHQQTKPLEYYTLQSKCDDTSKFKLPDSSIVWLNSNSVLKYNSEFGISNRDIELNGQAYLKVEHNKKLPLVVHCYDFQVKVIGTKFDVEAYEGSGEINVVLETGKVQLNSSNAAKINYTMQEGDMATYSLVDNQLLLKKVNPKHYSAWRNGLLVFREEALSSVFEKLERRYDIDIVYNISDIKNSKFTATISDETVPQIMKFIEMACSVECKIVTNDEKTKVVIEKK